MVTKKIGGLKCDSIEKIHRKYPDSKFDYKGLKCRTKINGKPTDVIFYDLKDKGKKSKGVEVYSGSNYIVGSNSPSYSRRYNPEKVPSNIKPIVGELKKKHSKTKWSSKSYMNLN